MKRLRGVWRNEAGICWRCCARSRFDVGLNRNTLCCTQRRCWLPLALTPPQVEWAHLVEFDSRLAEEIQRNFYVLQDFLVASVRPFIESIEPDYVVDDMGRDKAFQLAFKGVAPHVQLRDLKTCEIGKLISIVGTVTRTGDVRPELVNGTFLCLECRAEIRNVVQQFKYAARDVLALLILC